MMGSSNQWILSLMGIVSFCCTSTHGYSVLDASSVVNKATNSGNQGKNRILVGTAGLTRVANPHELLDAAFERGMRRFDLARTYNAGKSEEIFGAWARSRQIAREDLNIITKGGMGDDKYGDPNRPMLTREEMQKEIELSMKALGTDHVDLYMYHRDDPRIPVSQFVIWANELLIEPGLAKSWGGSNWSIARFREAYEFAVDNGLEPPRANSPQFSLAVPKVDVWPTTVSVSQQEHIDHIEWYERQGVELICWEVLAKGFMAVPTLWSKDDVDFDFLESDNVEIGTDEWRLQRIQRAYCHNENYRRRDSAIRLGNMYGKKLPQIAMLYPLSISNNVSVIFGPEQEQHLDDVLGLEKLCLDEEAMFELGRVSFLTPNLCNGRSLLDKRKPYRPAGV